MAEYPEKLTQGFYRVVESTDHPSIILGVFRVLSNAKKLCDQYPGSYVVYDEGVKVYAKEENLEEEESGGMDTPSESADSLGGESGSEKNDPSGGEGGTDASGEEPEGNEGGAENGETENIDGETGNVIAYGKIKTVMHIRKEPAEASEVLAIYNAKAIVRIMEFCDNGWLKILCPESATGIGYVSNKNGQYACIGGSCYVVTEEDDRLEAIAARLLGDESRYTEIRTLNMLTSNQTYVGMELILPA